MRRINEDREFVLTLASSFHDAGYISAIEKRKIEAGLEPPKMKEAIFELLRKKELKVAVKMFMLMRSVETDFESRKVSTRNPLRSRNENPLEMNPVIKCVFGYLDLGNLKNCRQVNKAWSAVAGTLLRKRSRISFRLHDTKEGKKQTPEEFFDTFSDSQPNLPFTSFAFKKCLSWPISSLNEFFDKQKTTIKELELCNLMLVNDALKVSVQTFQMSNWISNSPLTKLTIITDFMGLTLFVVNLSQLSSVKDLTLQGCKIVVENGIESRICPNNLDFHNVTISQDGEDLQDCIINNFIELKDIYSLSLISFGSSTILFLDLEDASFNADDITLEGNTRAIGWRNTKCSVDTLNMETVPLEKTTMKFNSLSFQDESIDLFALPQEIKILSITITMNNNPAAIQCSQPIALPFLKSLTLDVINLQPLLHFHNCVNLVDLDISCDEHAVGQRGTISVNLIPKTVKRLKMSGAQQLRHGQIFLETLVIESGSLCDSAKILDHIEPKILVLNWKKDYETNDSILKFIKKFKDISFYVGPFKWNELPKRDFQTSVIRNLIDKEGVYYVFKNQRGTSVRAREFGSLLRLK